MNDDQEIPTVSFKSHIKKIAVSRTTPIYNLQAQAEQELKNFFKFYQHNKAIKKCKRKHIYFE